MKIIFLKQFREKNLINLEKLKPGCVIFFEGVCARSLIKLSNCGQDLTNDAIYGRHKNNSHLKKGWGAHLLRKINFAFFLYGRVMSERTKLDF